MSALTVTVYRSGRSDGAFRCISTLSAPMERALLRTARKAVDLGENRMTVFCPMDVVMVCDDDGQHPEPPFSSEWSRIDELRWWAGITKALTGVEIRFNDTSEASGPGYHYHWPELIGVTVYVPGFGWSSSTSKFDSKIRDYMLGIEVGAQAALRLNEPRSAS